MATAEEIAVANTAFQALVAEEATVAAEYQQLRGPYLAKRLQLNEVRSRLETADRELEKLTADYQAPAAAQPE